MMVKEAIKKEHAHPASTLKKTPKKSSGTTQHMRLEALLNGQASVLEMIIQRAPFPSILEAIIHWIEGQSQNEMLASILLLDSDGEHLRCGAAPSLPAAYNQAIDGIQIGPANGSCGTAAYTKQTVVVENLANDPLWQGYREQALQYGLQACWSAPLIAKNGVVLGTFALYYRRTCKPTRDDLQIMQFAIHTAIVAIEQEHAEQARGHQQEQDLLTQTRLEGQFLYNLFMQAPAIIAVLRGPEHRYELANPRYMQIIGQERSIIGKSIRDALPELTGQGIFELLDRVYQTGEAFTGSEILTKLDKTGNGELEEVYFNFVYQPAYDNQRNIGGILVHAVDVTEQVKARQKAEKSQILLGLLANASKILSASLNYQDILENIARLSIPLFADFCVFDILNDDDIIERVTWAHTDKQKAEYIQIVKNFIPSTNYIANPVALSFRSGKLSFIPFVDDAWMRGAATSAEHLEFMRTLGYTSVLTTPLTIRGKISGTLTFIFTKDSQRHYSETDLHIAEEIASRAAMAIENSRLYQHSQKEIEVRKKLEEQKDVFIGVASHELKTPVTSVKAYVQILNRRFKKIGDVRSSELVMKMDTQLNKLTKLIGDLLDVTKIQNGKLQFQEEVFDFNALTVEIVEEMQRTTEKHEIVTELSQPQMVYGDRDRIGQVMINLLSNAIKYSPQAAKIIVKTVLKNDTVILSVQDFGVGIPEKKKDQVFERFFRVNDDQEIFSGLGLGLYISAEIVERHKGTIWVESEKGYGSTFSFSLEKTKGEQVVNTVTQDGVA
jgi:signal transduction histidine kinase/PAS domain-containing protein